MSTKKAKATVFLGEGQTSKKCQRHVSIQKLVPSSTSTPPTMAAFRRKYHLISDSKTVEGIFILPIGLCGPLFGTLRPQSTEEDTCKARLSSQDLYSFSPPLASIQFLPFLFAWSKRSNWACPVKTPGCTLSGMLGNEDMPHSSSHGRSSSSATPLRLVLFLTPKAP